MDQGESAEAWRKFNLCHLLKHVRPMLRKLHTNGGKCACRFENHMWFLPSLGDKRSEYFVSCLSNDPGEKNTAPRGGLTLPHRPRSGPYQPLTHTQISTADTIAFPLVPHLAKFSLCLSPQTQETGSWSFALVLIFSVTSHHSKQLNNRTQEWSPSRWGCRDFSDLWAISYLSPLANNSYVCWGRKGHCSGSTFERRRV